MQSIKNCHPKTYHSVYKKPVFIVNRPSKRNVVTKAMIPDISVSSYYIGKGIILFTMFYCSMNWLHYRNLRIKNEENKKNKK